MVTAVKLLINNLLEQEAHFKLTEQLPVGRNEKIKGRFIRSTPQIQPEEMEIFEWTLTLLHQEFTVEYPPDLTLAGLDV